MGLLDDLLAGLGNQSWERSKGRPAALELKNRRFVSKVAEMGQ